MNTKFSKPITNLIALGIICCFVVGCTSNHRVADSEDAAMSNADSNRIKRKFLIAAMVTQTNQLAPAALDEETQLDGAELLNDSTILFNYTLLKQSSLKADKDLLYRKLCYGILSAFRSNVAFEAQKAAKIYFMYNYRGLDGSEICQIRITPSKYGYDGLHDFFQLNDLVENKWEYDDFIMHRDSKLKFSAWYPKTWKKVEPSSEAVKLKAISEEGVGSEDLSITVTPFPSTLKAGHQTDFMLSQGDCEVIFDDLRKNVPGFLKILECGRTNISSQDAIYLIADLDVHNLSETVKYRMAQITTWRHGNQYVMTYRAPRELFYTKYPELLSLAHGFILAP